MSEPLHIEISALAAAQVRTAETWWRLNRPKAPGAIRAELECASSLIALHPQIGTPARNVALSGVRRLHLAGIRYDLYYRLIETPRRLEILAFGMPAVEIFRQSEHLPALAGFQTFGRGRIQRSLTSSTAATSTDISVPQHLRHSPLIALCDDKQRLS